MNMLFIVLVASSPILGAVFAASVVGLRPEELILRARFRRLSPEGRGAIQLTEKKAARRHDTAAQPSQRNEAQAARSGGTWRTVLGLPLNEHRRSVAHQAYRKLARVNHPDLCGSNAAMQLVNDAWKQAKKDLVLQ